MANWPGADNIGVQPLLPSVLYEEIFPRDMSPIISADYDAVSILHAWNW